MNQTVIIKSQSCSLESDVHPLSLYNSDPIYYCLYFGSSRERFAVRGDTHKNERTELPQRVEWLAVNEEHLKI